MVSQRFTSGLRRDTSQTGVMPALRAGRAVAFGGLGPGDRLVEGAGQISKEVAVLSGLEHAQLASRRLSPSSLGSIATDWRAGDTIALHVYSAAQ